MTKGIITKTGNSYAIRVPKAYITENNLRLGDMVTLEEPLKKQQKALLALVAYSEKKGPLAGIDNPVEWQREQRKARDPWRHFNGTTRH